MTWVLLAALWLGLGGTAAQNGSSAGNATCLACHGQAGATSPSGQSVYVDPSHFADSVHASLPCTACHGSIAGYPHPAKMEAVNCGTCHGAEAGDIAASVHAKINAAQAGPAGRAPSPLDMVPCLGCHGDPHAIVPVANAGSPVYPLNIPRTCGACHGNPALAKKYGFPDVYAMYMDSIHGFALTKDGLLVAASCSSCHGTHKILSHTDPQSRTYRANIPNTCGGCHAGPLAQYLAGIHGRQKEAGNALAPVCTSCHTAHQVVQVARASWQKQTSATCGSCHQNRYATYLDTFHAQVSAIGYVEAAHCWNCHGNHDILPPSDPKSSVNPANLLHTCQQCHPDANASFIRYQPHADPHNRLAYPHLWFTKQLMNLLLIAVLGFFFLHTILWFLRSMFDRLGRAARGEGKP